MRYLKSIRENNQPIKIFELYDNYIKNMKTLLSSLLSKHKVETREEQRNFIQNWEDADLFFNGEIHKEKYYKSFHNLLDDSYNFVDYFYDNFWNYEYFESLFDLFVKYLKSKNILIDQDLKDEFLKARPGFEEFLEFTEVKLDHVFQSDEFVDWAIHNDHYFEVFHESGDKFSDAINWVKNGNNTIYRMITLPDTLSELEELSYDGIGEYWTYDINKAESYWGKKPNNILITAEVECNDINWDKTLAASVYRLNNEKEINIIKGATLRILSFEINQKKIVEFNTEKIYIKV